MRETKAQRQSEFRYFGGAQRSIKEILCEG